MKRPIFLTICLIVFAGVSSAYSQQRKPCDHLTDPTAKRNCLVRELNEANRQQRLAQERMEILNLRMKRACDAMQIADQAARIAATRAVVNFANPVTVAGATWYSVRGIMSTLTREKKNCDSARQAVSQARRQ